MAADTFTSSLRIQLQGTGNNSETWGQITDVQFQKYEAAITGDNGFSTGGIDLTGQVSPYSLTANNGTLDQASNLLYPFSGTLTNDMTVFVPGVVKIGWAVNATSGGHNVILKVGSGATLTLAPGGNWTFFYCDGAKVIAPAITFGSGIGPITVNGNAVIHGTVSVDNSVTAGGGFISTALDDGGAGGQFRATFGSYGAMLRNDGANVYLLQTATGTPLGTFNSFRPYAWNLATGAVTIDGTGIGASFGGRVTVGGALVISGTPDLGMRVQSGNPTIAINSGNFIQWVSGVGTSFVSTGVLALSGQSGITLNGLAPVLNNSGTYAINISGTAAAANAVAWGNVSGKPFSFNQSADINASPTYTNIQANGFINVAGANAESSTGMVLEPSSITATPIAWNLPISVNCAQSVAAINFATVSDRRMKNDIHDLEPEEGVRWVKRGRPRHFTMQGRPVAGFIAQEDVESGRGGAISQVIDEDAKFSESDGYAAPGRRLLRDYQQDSAYLTAALKAAFDQIEKLTERIEELEQDAA